VSRAATVIASERHIERLWIGREITKHETKTALIFRAFVFSWQLHMNAAFIFIFFTVLLDMLALGVIVPVLPALVVAFRDGDTAMGASIYGLFATVWAVMQFICSPILGSLSDRFGRRKVILLSNAGLGLDYLLMAVAP
jgi:MFS family permease